MLGPWEVHGACRAPIYPAEDSSLPETQDQAKSGACPRSHKERCHVAPRLAQDLPHSPWGASQGLPGTFFYGTPSCFYLTGIKERLAQSVARLSVLLPAWPQSDPHGYIVVSGQWTSQGGGWCVG